ncbi:hypothetical protein [Pseudorhodobacter sp.]|uniref:hypothetical protein n=1 Tax=Pseudorhodobacter sp. TaxID=1934400 RepID=UPI002647A204|nr:hypothetical protein [Pseudorhodobacter sp.]MDN5786524.1 hypothetical protein [Pseudorhodobacter sp.]
MKLAKSDDTTPAAPPARRRAAPPVLRGLDQFFGIFENGEFLPEIIDKLQELNAKMSEMRDRFPGGKVTGAFTLSVDMKLNKNRDVTMQGTCTIKPPKSPPSSAVAFITDQGEFTLHSPMLTQMHGGLRDTYDPETGEIR